MSVNLLTCSPEEAFIALRPVVEAVVNDVVMPIARKQDPKYTGGYFTFWRREREQHLAVPITNFHVGTMVASPDRLLHLIWHAHEKASRLSQHHLDVSSWLTRDVTNSDPMKRKYGGAIRAMLTSELMDVILSFSGFPEALDEMVPTIVASRFGLINKIRVREIISKCGNMSLEEYFVGLPVGATL